jgi:Flp pilus assembly pilin Flp
MSAGGVAVTARQAIRREAGQTMAEYAVILGVITPVLVLLFTSLLDPIVDRITTLIGFLT